MEAYHFQISNADFFISAGNVPAWEGVRNPPNVYEETLRLEVLGEVIVPATIKGRPVSLTLYGTPELQADQEKPREKRGERNGIGFVDFWGKNQTACLWVSVSVLTSLLELIKSRATLDVVLLGEPMKHRKAAIHHFHTGTKFEKDDWY